MLISRIAILSCAILCGSAGAQVQDTASLKWDVISVKPMAAEACNPDEGGVRFLRNGLSATCVPVLFAVEFSYHLMNPARILGLPKWAAGPQLFGIEARVSAQDSEAFNTLNREQKAAMMQSVFAERFGMKAHKEMRELPAYALVVAKSGSKLKTSETGEVTRTQFRSSIGEVKWVNGTLTDFLFLLAEETGRPVINQTGLAGKYDFNLEYTPTARAATDDNSKPSIFTALEDQLGMKLVPARQSVEILVVDSIQQPTEN